MSSMSQIYNRIDSIIFIKRGLSFWLHLVPFSIASLVLIILSIPSDNLLLKLVTLLKKPSWIWLCVVLLTMVGTISYLLRIRFQIRQAYLWSQNDIKRTIITSIFYLSLCTLMAFAVLMTANLKEDAPTFSKIWACLIISVLSFTGIGWKGPNSLVKELGIVNPDYIKARNKIEELTETLDDIRKKETCEDADRNKLIEILESLNKEIDENIYIEPSRVRQTIQDVNEILGTLKKLLEQKFKDSQVRDLAAACRYQKEDRYQDFIEALKRLSKYWPKLKYNETNNGG